jgi:hypothetical protein
MAFIDRVLHECEPKTGPGRSFGGEEGVSNFGQIVLRDSAAVIRKGHS